jgi:hypothetical protein
LPVRSGADSERLLLPSSFAAFALSASSFHMPT